MTVGWKVHGLTKILSWNVTKWALLLNIWGLAENFIGWPWYSHRTWPNEVYFPHTKVSWKFYRLIRILSWNVTKLGLFLNIFPLAVQRNFFHRCCRRSERKEEKYRKKERWEGGIEGRNGQRERKRNLERRNGERRDRR